MKAVSDDPSGAGELARAAAFLGAGRLAHAEAACRALLVKDPRNPAAMHLLGLVRKHTGDLAGAERLIRESIVLAPRETQFHANLGNLLRRLGRLPEAADAYCNALYVAPTNRTARLGLARTLNDLGRHVEAEAQCRRLLADDSLDAQSWSALAMTLRDQNRFEEAQTAYRKAIRIEPQNATTHHNLGALFVAMDRPEEALEALQRAERGGVSGFEAAFNRGRALVQLYRTAEAEQAFAQAVALSPQHLEAQLNLVRVRFMNNSPDCARDLERAASDHLDDVGLQMLAGEVQRRSGDLGTAERTFRNLAARHDLPEVRASLAAVLHERGNLQEAEREVSRAAALKPEDPLVADVAITVMLACGEPDRASQLIQVQRALDPLGQSWIAYEATAARMLGQPCYRELYDYDRLVQIYDLEPPSGWSSIEEFNRDLLQALQSRHPFRGHPLDQSLRNGTQTARSLTTERDPAIRAALRAFEAPLADYQRSLGSDPHHPLSARNRGVARMVGAWSVQLRREGFHVNHVHPKGWISSAYYVALPREVSDEALQSGWLKFGETRFPIAQIGPERFVQPCSGRLVLFPSYMWHGTTPIHGSEPRVTIAFDAVPEGRGA